MRTIARNGLVIVNAKSEALDRVLAMGCWSRVEQFNSNAGWSVDDDRVVRLGTVVQGSLAEMPAAGMHNAQNALAAIAAAHDVGVEPKRPSRRSRVLRESLDVWKSKVCKTE